MSPECAHLYLSILSHLKVEKVKTQGHSGQLSFGRFIVVVGQDNARVFTAWLG